VYERLVQFAKKHLKVLLSDEGLDSYVFVTVLGGVESVINTRPLAYVSADSRDPEALTPFNFLCPGVVVGSTVHVIPPVPPEDGINLRISWQKSRSIVDKYWQRWSEEYIAMNQDRKKWKVSSPGLRVGRLVLLTSDDQPQDHWRLGIIDKLEMGSDEHTRQVTVRMANGQLFKRHCNALVCLEID
jgi:hypothetical protein